MFSMVFPADETLCYDCIEAILAIPSDVVRCSTRLYSAVLRKQIVIESTYRESFKCYVLSFSSTFFSSSSFLSLPFFTIFSAFS
jgi:hypothetical protein